MCGSSSKKKPAVDETDDDTIKRLLAKTERLESERSLRKDEDENKFLDVEKEKGKEVGSAASSSSGTEWKTAKGKTEKEKPAESHCQV